MKLFIRYMNNFTIYKFIKGYVSKLCHYIMHLFIMYFFNVTAFNNVTELCVIFTSLDPCPFGMCVDNGTDIVCM